MRIAQSGSTAAAFTSLRLPKISLDSIVSYMFIKRCNSTGTKVQLQKKHAKALVSMHRPILGVPSYPNRDNGWPFG